MTVEDEIAEGDKAVVRWMSRGTHRGDFYGLPPSGRQFAAPGIDIFALDRGRIREVWVALDALGMMQQLGAIRRRRSRTLIGHAACRGLADAPRPRDANTIGPPKRTP